MYIVLGKMFKKKSNSFLLNCGRQFGRWGEKEIVYIVGSTKEPIPLSKEQYQILGALGTAQTYDEWKKCLKSQGIFLLEQDFDEVAGFYREDKLFLEVTDSNNEELNKFSVVRNGIALGFQEGKWNVGAHNDGNKRVYMTKEEYHVWLSARGVSTISDTLDNINKSFDCDMKQALYLFRKYSKVFVEKLLWNIEYIHKAGYSSLQSRFDANTVKSETVLLPVGQELQTISWDQYQISLGNNEKGLTPEEFSIWTLLHQNSTTAEELAELMEIDLCELKRNILPSLLDKKAIIPWDKKVIAKGGIQFFPMGMAVKSIDENLVAMKASPSAKLKKIPMVAYLVWANISPFLSLEMILKALEADLKMTHDEIWEYFIEIIPYLVTNYLISIVVGEE